MDDPLNDLATRLAKLEATVARLTVPELEATGQTVVAPLRVVDAEGNVLLEIGRDVDGAFIQLNGRSGKATVVLGCLPDGGFVDVIQAGTGRLAVTLTATPDGGNVEVTDVNGDCLFDAAESRVR